MGGARLDRAKRFGGVVLPQSVFSLLRCAVLFLSFWIVVGKQLIESGDGQTAAQSAAIFYFKLYLLIYIYF